MRFEVATLTNEFEHFSQIRSELIPITDGKIVILKTLL